MIQRMERGKWRDRADFDFFYGGSADEWLLKTVGSFLLDLHGISAFVFAVLRCAVVLPSERRLGD